QPENNRRGQRADDAVLLAQETDQLAPAKRQRRQQQAGTYGDIGGQGGILDGGGALHGMGHSTLFLTGFNRKDATDAKIRSTPLSLRPLRLCGSFFFNPLLNRRNPRLRLWHEGTGGT